MTTMFNNFKTEADGIEQSGDRLGGFSLFETDVYEGTIKLLFFGNADSGAQYAEIHGTFDGRDMRERIFISNRAGENTYKDKQSGEPRFLPGFEMVNDLCLVTTGYGLVDLAPQIEEKVVNLYDYNAKKDLPQTVQCMTPVMGQPVFAAITKQTVDKQAKDGNGVYKNTGETRDENVFSKFFHAESHKTVPELRDGKEATFMEKWRNQYQGKTVNRAKGVTSGAPGRPAASAGDAQKPASSLFSK